MSLHYTKLVVWQRADDLFVEVHRLTHQLFPAIERYEMCRMVAGPLHGLIRHHRAKRITKAVVPIVTMLFFATVGAN